MVEMEGRGTDTDTDARDREVEPTSPRSPLAPYPSHSAELKSRAAEYYGFVAWISTYALFVLYLTWALLPDKWIVRLGIEWYPSREWSILLPAYSVVLILLTYFVYWALALYNTPAPDDLSTIIDSLSHIPIPADRDTGNARNLDEKVGDEDTVTADTAPNPNPNPKSTPKKSDSKSNVYLAAASPTAIPDVYDIPISLVNRVLYTQRLPNSASTPPVTHNTTTTSPIASF